jgi:hypothetical protein
MPQTDIIGFQFPSGTAYRARLRNIDNIAEVHQLAIATLEMISARARRYYGRRLGAASLKGLPHVQRKRVRAVLRAYDAAQAIFVECMTDLVTSEPTQCYSYESTAALVKSCISALHRDPAGSARIMRYHYPVDIHDRIEAIKVKHHPGYTPTPCPVGAPTHA